MYFWQSCGQILSTLKMQGGGGGQGFDQKEEDARQVSRTRTNLKHGGMRM